MKRTIRIIIILLFGLIICYREINELDNTFFLDEIINLGLEIAAFMYFIWTVYRDFTEFQKLKEWASFLPTIYGTTITIGLLFTLYLFDLRDKSPVMFSAVSKIVDFNGVRIDFREDGTYKLDNFCLGSNFFRGKYSIMDSIITLDKSNIDKVIVSNRLVIRADGTKDSIGHIEKSIYQINKEGKVIYGSVDYRILNNQTRQ